MEEDRFDFIANNQVLRTNLNQTFHLVFELLILQADKQYSPKVCSGFRKTIIIYTAAIIEVLLLQILMHHKTAQECCRTQKDKVKKRLYKCRSESIVLVVDECKPANFEKLSFQNINDLCLEFGLISKSLHQAIHKVKTMRNAQHLNTLTAVEKNYSKASVDMVFGTAGSVIAVAKKIDWSLKKSIA